MSVILITMILSICKNRVKYRFKPLSDLRHRFRKEYLGFLVQKKSQRATSAELRLCEIVLIRDDMTKRINWPITKVIQPISEEKDPVLSVKLKNQSSILLRPIQRGFFHWRCCWMMPKMAIDKMIHLRTPCLLFQRCTSRSRCLIKLPQWPNISEDCQSSRHMNDLISSTKLSISSSQVDYGDSKREMCWSLATAYAFT